MRPAPLQRRPADYSPSVYDVANSMIRTSTYSSMAASTPVGESDKLREEIMRTLSPVGTGKEPGAGRSFEERLEGSPPVGEAAGTSATVSRQSSEASQSKNSRADLYPPEPPSPLSVLSETKYVDRPTTVSPMPTSEAVVRPPPPSAGSARPTTSHGPGAATAAHMHLDQLHEATIPNFVDHISRIQDPAERAAHCKAASLQMASLDVGLGSWLSVMKERHPEHADVFEQAQTTTSRPSTGLRLHQGGALRHHQSQPQLGASKMAGDLPAGQMPSAQQPYYQQFLNASNPAIGGPPSGSAGSGASAGAGAGAPVPSPGRIGPIGATPSSGFKHGGNQVGTKSKEFLGAAAKAGKGLFTKGRTKLRGATDKVFY